MKEQQQFVIKREWLEKLKNESFTMRKDFFALVFNFGPDTNNYYILDEKTIKNITDNFTDS